MPCLSMIICNGVGVDEEYLADIKRERYPATTDKNYGVGVCMLTRRVENGPNTVNTKEGTEIEIQSKLDPTCSGRSKLAPVGEGGQLTKDPNETFGNRKFQDFWV